MELSHLPMHRPGSKEYEAACKHVQLFHDKTHIKDAGKIEKRSWRIVTLDFAQVTVAIQ